ncbi:putative peroxin 13 [Trypanosoma conorhini]|uniref:Putative peroxin 13 n=1 Tax=Trypanosoma conorhini TaxID=83891 RepID=A0A3R7L3M2_9TRYP|nr:putative peroxin 13 [Trypanosoma conorhini]RNF19018.1 putative peroxin 13 [Trypanosoma conorhini]
MSPMYGGYGGYGGGMSSMYGGYGGGMSSMYGGGLGTVGGITGGMSGGMINGGMPEGMNGLATVPNGQGINNSILPPQSDQSQAHVPSRPPAIEEGPRERRERRRQERKERKEALEKQRQQKRQFLIHSAIEITGHVLQTLVQILRSGLELFGVGFGTYYSIKALKALLKSQEDSISRKATKETFTRARKEVTGGGATPGPKKWKGWLLVFALFFLMETIYGMQRRYREAHDRRTTRREGRGMLTNKYDESLAESLSQSEELSSDEASSECSIASTASVPGEVDNKSGQGKRVFVAVFDYDAPEEEGFIGFKAGDRFVVEEYAENGWCEACHIDAYERSVSAGLVPGNFLRPLEGGTKL